MQYLYLIKCQHFYKIGIANDVKQRMAQLSTGNPFELEVLAVYGFETANAVETSLHQKFKKFRTRGEWFTLESQHISEFNAVCQLLGGIANALPTVDEEEIESADKVLAEDFLGGSRDFKDMFSNGWRMEKVQDENGENRYWRWSRGSGNKREHVYGGSLASLPHPIDEMRRIYKPLAQVGSVGNA